MGCRLTRPPPGQTYIVRSVLALQPSISFKSGPGPEYLDASLTWGNLWGRDNAEDTFIVDGEWTFIDFYLSGNLSIIENAVNFESSTDVGAALAWSTAL